jgi:hypothetical protein
MIIVESLRGLRKMFRDHSTRNWEIARAKPVLSEVERTPSTPSSDSVFPIAAFAFLRRRSGHALREIIRHSVAALPQWAFVIERMENYSSLRWGVHRRKSFSSRNTQNSALL